MNSVIDGLRSDLIFGWRQLLKRKVTSSAAVLSLALAIRACTSAFRLIDALLLRPLPVTAPERLFVMGQEGTDMGGNLRIGESAEYPLFKQLRPLAADQAELIAISYADRTDLTFGSDDEMEKAWRQYVSGWMFQSFGLRPAAGRLFTEADDQTPGAHGQVVLSYNYFVRRFGADVRAVGKALRIGNDIYEVIGVSPKGFTGTETGIAIDVFVPTMMHPYVTRSDASWFRTFVHLKPGVSPEVVCDRLRAPHQAFQVDRARGFTNVPANKIAQFLNQKLVFVPAAAGVSDRQKQYRSALVALGVLVGLVLLIACANVANLMTAQAAARSREMALRISIGAHRWRLVKLVLVESALLAVLAASLGAAFAWWSAPLVASSINPSNNPAHLDLQTDWRVALFGLALTLFVTCLFGLAPALRASGVKPMSTLRGSGDNPRSSCRMMHALIGVQVAFSFVVLFAAGLFAKSFDRLWHQPTGFSSDRILVVEAVSKTAQAPVHWEQVADRLRSIPGVERVAMSNFPILSGNGWNGFIIINGVPVSDVLAYFLAVTPGWMDTMRLPLLDGRDFQPGDNFPGVAIVNEAFARTYFDGANPVGKSFEKRQGATPYRVRIIGMVPNVRFRNMREPIAPVAFVPFVQLNAKGESQLQSSATFLIRTVGEDPLALAATLRTEVPSANSSFRVSNIRTQQQLVEQHTVRERVLAALALFFAAVALLLGCVGLYGVLDYSVVLRHREIGIRMAIGARGSDIVKSVASKTFAVVGAGALVGVALGMTSVKYIVTLLYGVGPMDPSALALPACAILGSAILASIPPALTAVRIDPGRMVRSE